MNSLQRILQTKSLIITSFDELNDLLTVHIIDTGKGIKAEEIEFLFTKFGKLQRTAEMNSEGIGMGLMICQNLVGLNHGTILVHSDGENKGARFTFTMKMSLAASRKVTSGALEAIIEKPAANLQQALFKGHLSSTNSDSHANRNQQDEKAERSPLIQQ